MDAGHPHSGLASHRHGGTQGTTPTLSSVPWTGDSRSPSLSGAWGPRPGWLLCHCRLTGGLGAAASNSALSVRLLRGCTVSPYSVTTKTYFRFEESRIQIHWRPAPATNTSIRLTWHLGSQRVRVQADTGTAGLAPSSPVPEYSHGECR